MNFASEGGSLYNVLDRLQRLDRVYDFPEPCFHGILLGRDEEGGRLMFHIVYRECGNLIRDATPYASADEAHEEAELLKEMKVEVIDIVQTA